MNRHIFQSAYYLWVVKVENEDDSSALLKVERSLTGKRKGPRMACVMDLYGIDSESPHGQWIRALQTDRGEFEDWVKSFHKSRKTKTVIVAFGSHTLICKPGAWDGCVGVLPQKDRSKIDVTSYPP